MEERDSYRRCILMLGIRNYGYNERLYGVQLSIISLTTRSLVLGVGGGRYRSKGFYRLLGLRIPQQWLRNQAPSSAS